MDEIETIGIDERKKRIGKLIEEEGIFSLNYSELGRLYGVSHTQIHRDVESIMSDMPSPNWVAILNKSQQELEYTIKVVSSAMENTRDSALKAKLASQLSEMILKKMSLMERMDRLLPASMKPEPITIVYRCVETPKKPKKDDLPEKEPSEEGIKEPDADGC